MIRRRPRPAALAAAAIAFVVLCLAPAAVVEANRGSFTMTIPYGTEECLLIRVPKDAPHIIR